MSKGRVQLRRRFVVEPELQVDVADHRHQVRLRLRLGGQLFLDPRRATVQQLAHA